MSGLLGEDDERLAGLGVDPQSVARAVSAVATSLRRGGKLLAFGNGGSAADAQHLAAELVGRFERERAPLAAIALTTNASALTAIANDYGFEHVFSRQLAGLGRPGDVALAISTSGSSANVLRAVDAARRQGMVTIGLCGAPGCTLCDAVDIAIAAPQGVAAPVQEVHLVVEHALCRALERTLFGSAETFELIRPGSVVSIEELIGLREGWRAAGLVFVWTNGCFDVLHAGHVASLRAARELGDVLVVGVNSDDSVRRLKGSGRPLMGAEDRALLVASMRVVDYVVVFDDDTPEVPIERLRPDIHAKGSDYGGPDGKPIPERALVESYGGRVELLPLVAARSTTELAKSIRDQGQ